MNNTTSTHTRPNVGDTASYPLFGAGTWMRFEELSIPQQAQAKTIDRQLCAPRALCLVADKSERVLRILG